MLSKNRSYIFCSYKQRRSTLLVDREIKFGGEVVGSLFSLLDKPEKAFYKINTIEYIHFTTQVAYRVNNRILLSVALQDRPGLTLGWNSDHRLVYGNKLLPFCYSLSYSDLLIRTF